MTIQYKGQVYVETPWGGYWEDCGLTTQIQDVAFDDVMRTLAINEEGHYQNITKTRVMSREISDWDIVAEGVVEDG